MTCAVVRRQTLPGYQLVIERGLRGDERLAFTPIAADPIAARLRKRGLNVRPGETCESVRAIGDDNRRANGDPILVLSGTKIG